MTKVVRFMEWARIYFPPGVRMLESSSVTWDFAAADKSVLAQFDNWKTANPDASIVSITGPDIIDTPPQGGMAAGKYVKLTVLYEDGQ